MKAETLETTIKTEILILKANTLKIAPRDVSEPRLKYRKLQACMQTNKPRHNITFLVMVDIVYGM